MADQKSKDKLSVLGARSKKAAAQLALLSADQKNALLKRCADILVERSDFILDANAKDMQRAKDIGMSEALLDRLLLTKERIEGIADGLRQVVTLEDPIGRIKALPPRPNGLRISEMTVPIGVIAVIYEARPNVTADVFSLCFKSGNAVILKGGSDALSSNLAITELIRAALSAESLPEDAILSIEDTDRESTKALMHLNEYVDLLIPRGGAGLIRTVVQESTIPVIETGTGNCHIYVDKEADLGMALEILDNAKTQRIGVCNACESLLVHRDIAPCFLPRVEERFLHRVELRADEDSRTYLKTALCATEEDWGKEYLDYILSVKTVEDLSAAISHINRYNSGHSDAIITADPAAAERFLREVDAACVYVNSSTRFTDGFEFGFGAEIGISTQKIHARGPMGLDALTSMKYIIEGEGQTRT